jgi:hypothetical protein
MINRFLFVLGCFLSIVSTSQGQTISSSNLPAQVQTNVQKKDTVKHFKYGGFSVLTFNQVNLSNWAAGGENALSTTGIVNLFCNYKKGKVIWDNTLDLGYGLMKNGSKEFRKNEDKMTLNSKLGYQAFGKIFYSVLVNFRSQFDKGYSYPNDTTQIEVSQFMAPGYLSISIGMDYKPADYFSLYVSPAAGKFTFVSRQMLADKGAFGVDPAVITDGVIVKNGRKVRPEFGASLSTRIQKDIVKNINVASKLALFNNYTDKDKANRKNVDVLWEVMVNIKSRKFLTTSIMTNLIYDQNIKAKTQFKEVFGIGLSYKF